MDVITPGGIVLISAGEDIVVGKALQNHAPNVFIQLASRRKAIPVLTEDVCDVIIVALHDLAADALKRYAKGHPDRGHAEMLADSCRRLVQKFTFSKEGDWVEEEGGSGKRKRKRKKQ
jgi:hypothetical protein